MRRFSLFFLALFVVSCGLFRDPRANCNHPQHEAYLREQEASRLAKQTRTQKKPYRYSRKAPKSCPNP